MIQTNRTLDEAYYPSLDDQVLGERNKDQVVTKECKKSLDGQILFEGQKPILMVSQLWIWRVDDWILSAYSEPGENPAGFDPEITSRAEVVLNRSLLVDQMIDSSKKGSCPEAVIGLLLAQQIDRFGKPQRVDEFGELRLIYQSPLDIFEIGVVRILSSVSKYINDNTSETLDITKERQFIHDISDIRSELAMIDEILSQQEEIMGNFIKDARRYFNVAKVVATQRQLERFRKRVTKIDKDAERIEKTIQDQLNLKRTHASIEDAHASVVIGQASLEFGRTSAILGMAVIGFATITIIFAPMAFVASLLALPIDIFDAHKVGDSKSYPTGYLGGWFGRCDAIHISTKANFQQLLLSL